MMIVRLFLRFLLLLATIASSSYYYYYYYSPVLGLVAASVSATANAAAAHMTVPKHRKVTLWNSGTCPYAQRVWIALKEKGIDFHYQHVDLQNKNDTPDFETAYYKANPNKLTSSKVPVLVVETTGASSGSTATTAEGDGHATETKYYTESKVVLEVIEEMFPNAPSGRRLLSADNIDDRYRARVFGDAVYDAIWGSDRSPYRMLTRKMKSSSNNNNHNNNNAIDGTGAGGERLEDEWNQAHEEEILCQMLEALDKSLDAYQTSDTTTSSTTQPRGGPFVCGDQFTIAECMTAPFVQRAHFLYTEYLSLDVLQLCERRGYARAGAWWKAVLERPSVQETATPDPYTSIQRIMDRMK
jgi:glutathione S-transferase